MVVNFSESEREADSIVRNIEQAGGRAMAVRANIAREAEVIELFQTAERTFGYVGGLVNNAAITGGFSRVDSVTTEALERVLAVNVTGTILCAREAVRRMSTRHGGKGGAIVNISSLVARTGGAGEWVHYAASKGAVNSFTIGLAREVAGEGIRVNAVSPGLIETELHARNGDPGRLDRMSPTVPMRRGGRPEEIASRRVVAIVSRGVLHHGRHPGDRRREVRDLKIASWISRRKNCELSSAKQIIFSTISFTL